MKLSPFINAITRQLWAIDPMTAYELAPVVKAILEGKFQQADKSDIRPLVIDAAGRITALDAPADPTGPSDDQSHLPAAPISDEAINPEQAVIGVIPICGPIMKEDTPSGAPGSATLTKWFQSFEQNPKVSAIILSIDSPGGEVNASKCFADVVAACTKPVLAYVSGTMASGSYWIGCGAKKIIADNGTSFIGSLGVMMNYLDVLPVYEKQGAVNHEVYADGSENKNRTFREMLKGNYGPIKENALNPMREIFVSDVIAARGKKITTEADGVLSGEIYHANLALTKGLIDGIGNFDYAVIQTRALIENQKTKTQLPMKTFFQKQFTAILAFLSIKAEDAETTEVTAEHFARLEAEVSSASILRGVNRTLAEEKIALTAALKSQEQLTAEAISKAGTDVTAMTTDRDAWKAKAVKYGAQDGAVVTEVKAAADPIEQKKNDAAAYVTSTDAEAKKLQDDLKA
jgi:signal peptide peptidase SppA